MNFVTAGCWFPDMKAALGIFLPSKSGASNFQNTKKSLRVTDISGDNFCGYTVFKGAVKMSDFPLSLEDIDLLINGKIPLIISQNRPSRVAYQVLYSFILAIHQGIRNRLQIHWSPFHLVVQFNFGDP